MLQQAERCASLPGSIELTEFCLSAITFLGAVRLALKCQRDCVCRSRESGEGVAPVHDVLTLQCGTASVRPVQAAAPAGAVRFCPDRAAMRTHLTR